MQCHVLIVDDDSQVTSFLERFFAKNGYRATGVATAAAMFEALARVPEDPVDLVILDLILPDEDGLDAARRLQRDWDIPIIMLSARDAPYDRIVGLELGADDYVTKPYEPRELLARVRSVLRRHNPGDGAGADRGDRRRLQLGAVDLDLVEGTARQRSDGANLNLTSTEFDLLAILADAGTEVVTRAQILDRVRGGDAQITDRAIDTHIVRLRRKLAPAAGGQDLIVTVHGKGYRLATRPRTAASNRTRTGMTPE